MRIRCRTCRVDREVSRGWAGFRNSVFGWWIAGMDSRLRGNDGGGALFGAHIEICDEHAGENLGGSIKGDGFPPARE